MSFWAENNLAFFNKGFLPLHYRSLVWRRNYERKMLRFIVWPFNITRWRMNYREINNIFTTNNNWMNRSLHRWAQLNVLWGCAWLSLLVYKLLLGPMVPHYALGYGFHTLPNMLIQPLREARGFVYRLGICIHKQSHKAIIFRSVWKPYYRA